MLGRTKGTTDLIRTPTVLVLGAGSSVHLGYPLGATLVANLCKLRGTSELDELPKDWSRKKVEEFLTHLSKADPYSIDAFLESRPDQSSLGKYLIARELKKHEDLNLLFPPNNSGWYRYLLNSLLADYKNESDFFENKISIITFNYDRSLEAYLHETVQERLGFTRDQATKALAALNIVHVHGILGAYPETCYKAECTQPELLEISRQIQIIHEIQDNQGGFCNAAFEQGHELLSNAERIFFLGFGFHPDNIRRFNFFTPDNLTGKFIKSTCQGWDGLNYENLKKRLKKMGVEGEPLHQGTDCLSFFSYQAHLE